LFFSLDGDVRLPPQRGILEKYTVAQEMDDSEKLQALKGGYKKRDDTRLRWAVQVQRG
jgi:hypothetical protein